MALAAQDRMEIDDHEEFLDELDYTLAPMETYQFDDDEEEEDMEELFMVIETQPEEGDGYTEDIIYLSLVFATFLTRPEAGSEGPDESVEMLMDEVFEDFTERRRSGTNIRTSGGGGGARSISCVEGLVKFQYSCEEEAAQACAICLDDFSVGTEAVRLPCRGKHVFHGACILRWLSRNCNCPLCLFVLPLQIIE